MARFETSQQCALHAGLDHVRPPLAAVSASWNAPLLPISEVDT